MVYWCWCSVVCMVDVSQMDVVCWWCDVECLQPPNSCQSWNSPASHTFWIPYRRSGVQHTRSTQGPPDLKVDLSQHSAPGTEPSHAMGKEGTVGEESCTLSKGGPHTTTPDTPPSCKSSPESLRALTLTKCDDVDVKIRVFSSSPTGKQSNDWVSATKPCIMGPN